MSMNDIRNAAASGELIVITGAGTSLGLTTKAKSAQPWTGLIKSALVFANDRGLVNDVQLARHVEALASPDLDDLLGAAEFVGRKLNAPEGETYARWMNSAFKELKPEAGGMKNAFIAIEKQKIPIATLNYDTLLESCTGLPTIDLVDKAGAMAWARREREGILHLHGVWTNPKNCIFGIRDYHNTKSDEFRDLIQRSLSSFKRLLFVGCGDTLADPNFSSLVKWLRANVGANSPQHYALVRNSEVKQRLADPNWRDFVEPLGFGDNHHELPGFLLNLYPTKPASSTRRSKASASADRHFNVIQAYREFILRDCGEMTVEGMRADMETAQRKFDLEKLFVPLEVSPFPPIFDKLDPDRDAKLQEWHQENAAPISFGDAFKKYKKMALLALPGAGKTILLKRLAVAYAHPARLALSNDNLPPLDLLPVMIRCREWKDEIRKPIPTLIKSMAAITGENNLEGLSEALIKPLKSGNVILLVDGLDEIHSDADRSIFVVNLEKFLLTYPKISLLVTSREAGFDLVAPCLVRFCEKLKIAPLNDKAITDLCGHWHKLMIGSTADAITEGSAVATTLLSSDALKRLAENPLLLTMLLVVKHGAGRLPPDRVSLYDRAVEVLLDTWNIKGHAALNVKEAVPQLACVAFELLRRGKQTATEQEILSILERARATLPMVGRYAKDSPYDFLKRVELRSSLMLEGGHTSENHKIVPFYQFRHLTFQEYLAAVAAVEGYSLSAEYGASLLSALTDNLVSDEWKEVVPMAAVLARKQAEPLIDALVKLATQEKLEFLNNEVDLASDDNLPPATARLAQALVEEAIFRPDVLEKAVALIAFFARGCRNSNIWRTLSRGPYGKDLRDAAFVLFNSSEDRNRVLARNTVALLEAHAEPTDFWTSEMHENEIISRLELEDPGFRARAILSVAGSFWLFRAQSLPAKSTAIFNHLEKGIYEDDFAVQTASLWAWGFWRFLQAEMKQKNPPVADKAFERISNLLFEDRTKNMSIVNFTLNYMSNISRNQFENKLTIENNAMLTKLIKSKIKEIDFFDTHSFKISILRVGFATKNMFSDEDLIQFVERNDFSTREREMSASMFKALGISQKLKRNRL